MNQNLLFAKIIFLLAIAASVQSQTVNPDFLQKIKIRNIGPAAMSGRITTITADPNDSKIIYAGAASGGLWRSQNQGLTWQPIFDKAPTQSIGSVAVSRHNPDEIWVGTGEGNPRNSQNFGIGMFKTLDGGKNWKPIGLENTKAIHRVILHRDNPDVAWAAAMGSTNGANPERGVFKTTDGGKTWRKVLFVNDLTGCADLVVDPKNPNKLVAAMWEYRRWPWKFKSGGTGSGIYISHDGGENWTRVTDKEGLPEGDLGRCGLAIAASNPNTIYALVEAKENALFKSTDGGKSWRKMATKGQGDRPFYYSEIYVDPKDENTVYTIFTVMNRSIDGGKTFEPWVGWEIHLDHHAMWISPDDPNFMVNGNDGGLNITRDGGKSWHFAENIPVGQFYHIRTDNDIPYNIYGGLQDNGTWVGPSSVWKAGGIRNPDWQEIYFGDGFDAMPLPDNNRFIYAMSQGGELSLVDRKTGDDRYIKPLHPDGKILRFHWNSALAADPFNPKGVFYGSQFVHHSENLGQNWQLLSPDLTTNDTMMYRESQETGGLTPDITAAENHCTILTIAPSPVQRGVIWAGTDDGNVQLTTDGGKSWTNFSQKIKDFPKDSWIPQIQVSERNAGEAFVVVNNYRNNDWQPYLFHTSDFGKTWSRLANGRNVAGFCLSVVQDPVEPNLIFLGTDQGLHFSIDYGKTWQKWAAEGFPSCPVQDMEIQKRESDLVIGTFGRAIWVLDNLSPLREIARSGGDVLKKDFAVFAPQPSYLAAWRSYDGTRFTGSAIYSAENKGSGCRVPIWVNPDFLKKLKEKKKAEDKSKGKKEEKPEAEQPVRGRRMMGGGGSGGGKSDGEKAQIVVLSMSGDTIWRQKISLDTCFNQFNWGLQSRGVRMPSNDANRNDDSDPFGGGNVLPGEYKIKVKFGGIEDSTIAKVLDDPRLDRTTADHRAKNEALRKINQQAERATKAYDRLKEAEKTMKLVDDALANVPDSLKKSVADLAKPLRDSISNLKEKFFQQKEPKGIDRDRDGLNSKIEKARGYIGGGRGEPSENSKIAVRDAEKTTDEIVAQVNQLFDNQWKAYRRAVEAVQFSLFKE